MKKRRPTIQAFCLCGWSCKLWNCNQRCPREGGASDRTLARRLRLRFSRRLAIKPQDLLIEVHHLIVLTIDPLPDFFSTMPKTRYR